MSEEFNIPENNNSFEAPEGYFDSFSKRLMQKIEQEEELKEYPELAAIEKTNAFGVPDAYFETFAQKLQNKIHDRKEAKVFRLAIAVKKYRFAIAAVFVLAIGSTIFYKMNAAKVVEEQPCLELACLTPEEITSSKYFNQISLSELETMAGQDIQDSLKAEINEELIDELIQHPEELNLSDDDFDI